MQIECRTVNACTLTEFLHLDSRYRLFLQHKISGWLLKENGSSELFDWHCVPAFDDTSSQDVDPATSHNFLFIVISTRCRYHKLSKNFNKCTEGLCHT